MARIKPRKWKDSEKELLARKIIEEHMPWRKVRIRGRTSDGIRRQAVKLELVARERHPAPTPEQKEMLRQLYSEGFRATQIAQMNVFWDERTASAIQKYLSALGLVNPNRSLATRRKKVWVNGESEAFNDFLRQNSLKYAPKEIAQMFGVKKVTVVFRQRKLGIKPPASVVAAMPFVQRRIRESLRRHARKILARFGRNIARRQAWLEKLAEIIRWRDGEDFVEISCRECGKKWPRHPKFFHRRDRCDRRAARRYFTHTCVICVSKKRHKKNLAKFKLRCAQEAI